MVQSLNKEQVTMNKRCGSTAIELLVVISIIALLLAILMPSLGIVKRKAQGVICMSNNRQIGIAWFTHAEDNNSDAVSTNTDLAYGTN